MSNVKMYTTGTCPYCLRAKQLLKAKGIDDINEIRVDLQPGQRDEMQAITGRHTVPQIFIGGQHIGGCDELMALDAQGKLDGLLAGQAAT